MAKISDIQINVGLTISEDTAQRCCQILSLYLTDNPNLTIEVFEFHQPDHIERSVTICEIRSEND